MKENPSFTNWSTAWKLARDNGTPEVVLELWRKRMPVGWEREDWAGELARVAQEQ